MKNFTSFKPSKSSQSSPLSRSSSISSTSSSSSISASTLASTVDLSSMSSRLSLQSTLAGDSASGLGLIAEDLEDDNQAWGKPRKPRSKH